MLNSNAQNNIAFHKNTLATTEWHCSTNVMITAKYSTMNSFIRKCLTRLSTDTLIIQTCAYLIYIIEDGTVEIIKKEEMRVFIHKEICSLTASSKLIAIGQK